MKTINQLQKVVFVLFLLGGITNANAQFWKKLTKKIEKKIERKVEEKIDKETDKAIDKTLDGKQKEASKKSENKKAEAPKAQNRQEKDYGDFSINHSVKFGTKNIEFLGKPTIHKKGDEIRIHGAWITHLIDVHDGYQLILKNGVSIDNINNKKRFSVPDEAYLKLNYAITKDDSTEAGAKDFQEYELTNGYVELQIDKDKKIDFSFQGNANITLSSSYNEATETVSYNKTNATVSGKGFAIEPDYRITKVVKENEPHKSNDEFTEADKDYIRKKLSPTVTIPSSFSFNKNIELEISNNKSGEKHPMGILIGNYPDIYGMTVTMKEMQGQGNVIMVMTPKSSTAFMDVMGMKMKKTTSLSQLGSQYKSNEKLPDGADFEYKKTGNTKTVAGYNCQEYRVDYNYENQKGTASLWVSKGFPIQNMELPILGMTLNNPYIKGFVLEINTKTNNEDFTMKVIKVTNKSLTINTNEYRNMGF